jgi:hypothetical protein
MSKKRRRTKNYTVSGTIEVINITKGSRCANILNLDEPIPLQKKEISGSIVIKSANYERESTETSTQEENDPNGPGV